MGGWMCFGNPFYCKSTLSLFFLLSIAAGNESSTINSISLTIITSINQNFYGLRFLEYDGRNSSKKEEIFCFLLICGDGKIKNRPSSLVITYACVFIFKCQCYLMICNYDVSRCLEKKKNRNRTKQNTYQCNLYMIGFPYRNKYGEKMCQYTFWMI